MNKIYKPQGNIIEYFICQFEENESISFSNETEIGEKTFAYSSVSTINIKSLLTKIKKSAFEECSNLSNFVCGEIEKDKNSNGIQGICLSETDSNFTLQKDAFKNCSELETVIFPKCSKLVIEKNAFSGCELLRTVVALCDDIEFTENPFECCPEYLTFICFKDSGVEKFARENGYRSIYVE